MDDHYVPDRDNAHVDTSDLEHQVREVLKASVRGIVSMPEWTGIFRLIETILEQRPPQQPNDDQLICRYFSPQKFLLLLAQKAIHFGSAIHFDDVKDSRIPSDFDNAVLSVLGELGLDGDDWHQYLREQQARWAVSCWTHLKHWDDHLLWRTYAGGDTGIGVTVKYGVLRKQLLTESPPGLVCGSVGYGTSFSAPPFNKRRIFESENEVRFAIRGEAGSTYKLGIEPIWKELGLRFSPDVSELDSTSIRKLWLQHGGVDRFQISGA